MGSPSQSLVPVNRDYLGELIKKAIAWDKHQEKSEKINSARLQVERHPHVTLDSKINISRAVPLDQTILVTNLPCFVSGVGLMNSFLATGGIRQYQIFSESGNDVNSLTALITFVTSDSARNYLSYVSRHGFFLSKRLPVNYSADAAMGECVYTSPDRRFQCLFKRAPGVIAKPWLGVERVAGKLITGDEGGYCNVSRAIEEEGATRSLVIIPGIEIMELHEELKYLIAVPELKIESSRFRTDTLPTKGFVTIIRFCSIRDAVMAKNYLSLLKSFSGPNGKMVKYARSPTDIPTENLGWHNCSKPKPEKPPPTGGEVASDTATDRTPSTEIGGSFKTTYSDEGDSDADSDMREISFSLAKEAFRPYIATSLNKICFPSLCHTPVPGNHTPVQLGHYQRPENQPILEDKVDNSSVPVTHAKSVGVGGNSSPRHEINPSRKEYPHEFYLSKKEISAKYADSPETLKSSINPINMRNLMDVGHPTLPGGSHQDSGSTLSSRYGSPQKPHIETRSSARDEMTKHLDGLNATAHKLQEDEELLKSLKFQKAALDKMDIELTNKPEPKKQT